MDFFQMGYTKICNTGKTKSHKEIYVVSNGNNIYSTITVFYSQKMLCQFSYGTIQNKDTRLAC